MLLVVAALTDPGGRRKLEHAGRKTLRALGRTATETALIAAEIKVMRDLAQQSLGTYETPSWRTRTVHELCAVLLAQAAEPMTATELLTALHRIDRQPDALPSTASELSRLLTSHPAFTRTRSRWTLGGVAARP